MDFSFTAEQESLRSHLRELLDDVCPPGYAERCDSEGTPPREAYDALALEYQVASQILRARARAGLTQDAVAEKMGTTKSAISRLDRWASMRRRWRP